MDGPTPVKVLEKVWGLTRTLSADRNCEVHHATIEPNTWCSRHFHAWKWNLFYVIEGTLLVHFYRTEFETQPHQTFEIKKGESFKVAPRQWHKFESLCKENVELIEVYWAEDVVADDIVRADVGGRASHQSTGDGA